MTNNRETEHKNWIHKLIQRRQDNRQKYKKIGDISSLCFLPPKPFSVTRDSSIQIIFRGHGG